MYLELKGLLIQPICPYKGINCRNNGKGKVPSPTYFYWKTDLPCSGLKSWAFRSNVWRMAAYWQHRCWNVHKQHWPLPWEFSINSNWNVLYYLGKEVTLENVFKIFFKILLLQRLIPKADSTENEQLSRLLFVNKISVKNKTYSNI